MKKPFNAVQRVIHKRSSRRRGGRNRSGSILYDDGMILTNVQPCTIFYTHHDGGPLDGQLHPTNQITRSVGIISFILLLTLVYWT